MSATLPQTTAPQGPICVACVGDRTNPDGGPCLRCRAPAPTLTPVAS